MEFGCHVGDPRFGNAIGGDVTRSDVTVALITRNGMATLPAVLDGLAAQRFSGTVEVVAVDTESTDGTAETLAARVGRVVQVRREAFDHGLTRNLAIEQAGGELVVLLVQDAVPASGDWLEALTQPLRADPAVAGTFARQLPRPDASRLTRWSLARWVAAREEPHVGALADPGAWSRMHPMDRFLACVFDNVCSCVRRSVWADHRFAATPIAEDLAWGREVVLAGHRLVYVPSSAVIHSHERSARYELGRTYLVHRRLHELFGVRTIPGLHNLARSIAVTLADHLRVLRAGEGPRPGGGEVARALALAAAWPLGQYLGGLAATRGREYLKPRGV